METSLHRALKQFYMTERAAAEVKLGRYRIDVVRDAELVEIQHGSLAAIRDKIRALTAEHDVRVVKPIVVRKTLVKRARKNGKVVGRRTSPKHGSLVDLFDELIYFRRVFPHPRLVLDVVLVDVEEWRYPGHGRRRRYRKNDFVVEDQKLCEVRDVFRLATGDDLRRLAECPLPSPFDTSDLAKGLGIRRWIAQRIAYCYREMGIARTVGKRGNSRLYDFTVQRAA